MRKMQEQTNSFTGHSVITDNGKRESFIKSESGLRKAPGIKGDEFCTFCNNSTGFGISKDEISRKVLFIGDAGSGKTNAFYQLFEQMDVKPDCVNIIFDSKGDFIRRFADLKDYVVIDGFTSGANVRWNVFEEILADENPEGISREIMKIINTEKKNANAQKFFHDSVTEVMNTASAVLCNDYYVKGIKPDNKMFSDFLHMPPEQMLARAKEYGLESRINKLITPAVKGSYNGQTLGVLGELNNLVSDLFVGNFAEHGDYSLRRAIRNRDTRNIFIEYDLTYGRTLSPIYSCLIMLVIKEALGRANTPKINLFIDEFPLLDFIPDMEAAVSFGREQGLFIAASLQHIGQVRAKYGEDIADGMLNNFRNLFAFKIGDFHTREFVKNRFGEIRRSAVCYRSLSDRISTLNFESKISDEDITSLLKGEAIISTADSNEPFRFRFKNVKDGG